MVMYNNLLFVSGMKNLFLLVSSTLLLIAFVHVSSANVGRTNRSGCHVCTHNCEALRLAEGELHCHLKITSKFLTVSSPFCPEKSSYNRSHGRCQCFQGHFAKGDKCVPYIPLSERCAFPEKDRRYFNRPWCTQEPSKQAMCLREFGKHAVYTSQAKSCTCADGYTMTAQGTCKVFAPSKNTQSISETSHYQAFTREPVSLGKWIFTSQKLKRGRSLFGELSWSFSDNTLTTQVRKYRIQVGDRTLGKWVEEKYVSSSVHKIQFPYSEDHSYKVFLKAFDADWKTIQEIMIEL